MTTPSAKALPRLVAQLRAAGESTRLRLLVLCAEDELSVSDLAKAVGQSEPRVSRHLKIMSEAGLIERSRYGQWVHYRATRKGAAAGFVQGLIAQLDLNDPIFARYRENLRQHDATPAPLMAETRLGRALRVFIEMDSSRPEVGPVLIVGAPHLEIMNAVSGRPCKMITASRRLAQAARAQAEREGIACQVWVSTSEALNSRDTERAGQPFADIVLDRLDATAEDLSRDLAVARGALRRGGRLWLFERYDALEGMQARVVEHPIGRIRRILGEAGFACKKLSPIESDGEHVLAASAALAQESNVDESNVRNA